MTVSPPLPPSESWFRDLELCAPFERARLERRVQQARGRPDALASVREEVVRVLAEQATRRAVSLDLRIPSELPIAAHRDELLRLIQESPVLIVCGETGSGKSTQLPKLCLALGRGREARIAQTQPRRIAARSIAGRLREEMQPDVAQAIAYRVRFDDQTQPQTLVQVMTDGVLLAEIPRDPLLLRYDTLIVDEAHERTLNIDFILGYVKQLLPRRPDLRLVITSATLDAERFARHFQDAPIVTVHGRAYPVELRYRPLDLADGQTRDLHDGLVDAVRECLAHGPGDVLCFLPGERDIRDAAEALEVLQDDGLEVVPLFARLTSHEQQRVFEPHVRRRVVLSTNVAETSLTVPGIRYVVDTGLARLSRYSPRLRLQRLPIEPIARSAAQQRAGRCGRLGPGVCVRLYSEEDLALRDEWTTPEIQRTNLASVILQMKALGLGEVEAFPFLDPPRPGQVQDGMETLYELRAVDEKGRLTRPGRRLARLPVDPRMGRMLLTAHAEQCLEEVVILVAALSVQDPRERPAQAAQDADRAHARFADPRSDFLGLLRLWHAVKEQEGQRTGSGLRRWCAENHLSFLRLREWQDVRRQINGILREAGLGRVQGPGLPDAVHRSVLSGLLAHVARRADRYAYQGPGGARIWIFPGSALFAQGPAWIVSAERVETARPYARTVAAIQRSWVEEFAPHLLSRRYFDPHWDEDTAQVLAFEQVTLWGLPLVERRRIAFGRVDPVRAREIFLRHALVHGHFRSRAPFVRHNHELMLRLRDYEQRVRRRNLLADPEDRYAFFDQRVPQGVTSGQELERFLASPACPNRKLLFLREEDLLLEPMELDAAEAFPDWLLIHGVRCPLHYRFEPGHAEDGISIDIPLKGLRALESSALERLVPGHLSQVIEALLRTLRRELRRELVPLPDAARRLATWIAPRPGPLLSLLCEQIAAHERLTVRPRDFSPQSLDPHLVINVRVLDELGVLIDQGRDLFALKRRLLAEVSSALAQETQWSRSGLTTWDFPQVPEHQIVAAGALRLPGWPTLVDRHNGVDQVIADTPQHADLCLPQGVCRLLATALAEPLHALWRKAPGRERWARQHQTRGTAAQIKREVLDAVLFDAAGLRTQVPRTQEAFEQTVISARPRLAGAAQVLWPHVDPALRGYQGVARKLMLPPPDAYRAPIEDLVEQLACLFGPDWLVVAGPNWRAEYGRYLAAMERRLEALGRGELVRDARLRAQILPHWGRYRTRIAQEGRSAARDPALEMYRWMIEEYRVSLFAQDLGVRVPVSIARLDAQWSEVLDDRQVC